MAFFETDVPSGGSGGSGGDFVSGSYTVSTSEGYTVNCGFQPKYIFAGVISASTQGQPMSIYNYDQYATRILYDSGAGTSTSSIPNTSNNRIGDVTSTGFTINKVATTHRDKTMYYFAIG